MTFTSAKERIGIDCDTFGYPVIQVDTVGNNAVGSDSGIQPAFKPASWGQDNRLMSATIRQVYKISRNSLNTSVSI